MKLSPEVYIKGRSHEEIIIKKDSSNYTISTFINRKPLNSTSSHTIKTVAIRESEWNTIQKLIKESNILNWQQRNFYNTEVIDGANTILDIIYSDGQKAHFTWVNTDSGSAEILINFLISLAYRYIPDNRFTYLVNIK
jgi:hypothetical protein